MKKTMPDAPPPVANAINSLARIRELVRQLKMQSGASLKIITTYGKSCNTENWTAYVSHCSSGTRNSFRKARITVKIIPRKIPISDAAKSK